MRAAWLLFVVGCTHHRDITEAHVVSGEVEVSGQYGQTVKATAVATPGVGVTFYDKANGGVVPPEEIYKIEDTSHLLGAVQGLGIGGGIGIVAGAVLGFMDGDDECNDDHGGCILSFSAGEKATILGVVFGAVGGGLGLVIGGAMGSTTVYERKTSQARVVPVGPSGSTAGVTVRF